MVTDISDRRAARSALLGWALTLIGVSVAALGGYVGFRWAATLDLADEAGAGLVALGAVTGFAVLFSPCSFPLLVGMLAGPTSASGAKRRPRDGATSALAIGLGAAIFLLLTGVVIGLIGDGLDEQIGFSTTGGRVIRGLVAGVLLVSGLVQLGLISLPLWRVARLAGPLDQPRVKMADRHRRGGQVLYGFGFVLAGFG